MSKRSALAISGDGQRVTAVYNDSLNELRDLLGKPQIDRASHVRYDSEREMWVARRVTGEFLCEDKSRDNCVEEEVRILARELPNEL